MIRARRALAVTVLFILSACGGNKFTDMELKSTQSGH